MASLTNSKKGHDWLLGNVGIIPTLYRFLFWRTSLNGRFCPPQSFDTHIIERRAKILFGAGLDLQNIFKRNRCCHITEMEKRTDDAM